MAERAYQDPQVLKKLYIKEDLTQQEIADKLGVGDSTISNWIRRHNIEKEQPPWRDEELLRTLYLDEKLSIREVATELDTDVTVIHRWMKRFEIPRRTPTYERDYPWHDEATLRKMYFQDGMSQEQIAEELGTSQPVISDWFQRHGIETPSYAEAGQIARRVNRAAFYTDTSGYEQWIARDKD